MGLVHPVVQPGKHSWGPTELVPANRLRFVDSPSRRIHRHLRLSTPPSLQTVLPETAAQIVS